jgi:hypothetical protein
MWVMLGEMFPNQIRGSGLCGVRLCAMDRQCGDLGQLPLVVSPGWRSPIPAMLAAAVSFFFVRAMVRDEGESVWSR